MLEHFGGLQDQGERHIFVVVELFPVPLVAKFADLLSDALDVRHEKIIYERAQEHKTQDTRHRSSPSGTPRFACAHRFAEDTKSQVRCQQSEECARTHRHRLPSVAKQPLDLFGRWKLALVFPR